MQSGGSSLQPPRLDGLEWDSLNGSLGASAVSGSKRAVRLVQLRPQRELRLLLHSPSEADASTNLEASEAAAASAVAVKLLSNPTPRSTGNAGNSQANAGAAAQTAEIFGKELLPEVEVELPEASRVAVFSWGGCVLQVRGLVQQEYEAGNAAMSVLLNLSECLNARRHKALLANSVGPKVLVTGSNGSGKSSACEILCNYAMRSGWTPAFVELDSRGTADKAPFQVPPGCIGASVCTSLQATEPECMLSFFLGTTAPLQGASVPSSSNSVVGLVSMECEDGPGGEDDEFGRDSSFSPLAQAELSAELFRLGSASLSAALHAAIATAQLSQTSNGAGVAAAGGAEVDEKGIANETQAHTLAASGFIANAPQLPSVSLLQQLIATFGFDIVLVVDHPSLCHDLTGVCGRLPESAEEATQRRGQVSQAAAQPSSQSLWSWMPPQRVEVVAVPKLEGAVGADEVRVSLLRRLWLRRYLKGSPEMPLSPQTLRLPFRECILLTPRLGKALPLSAMPAGMTTEEGPRLRLVRWKGAAAELTNALLAVPASQERSVAAFSSGVAAIAHVCGVSEDAEAPLLSVRLPAGVCHLIKTSPVLLVPQDLRAFKCFLDV